jgi:carboxylate-amine ligase
MLLVGPDDLTVDGGRVTSRGEPVGVVYLRIDGELADLHDGAGRPVGAGLLDAAAAGALVLANAPGNGVADDKATYCWVAELIGYYLHERPLLDSVPTYRPADQGERHAVLERVGELVTKPVDGYGGSGVLIGPAATAAEVVRRRAEIAAQPAGWVAQEVVALSSAPTLDGGALHPRHVDLRAFVCSPAPARRTPGSPTSRSPASPHPAAWSSTARAAAGPRTPGSSVPRRGAQPCADSPVRCVSTGSGPTSSRSTG